MLFSFTLFWHIAHCCAVVISLHFYFRGPLYIFTELAETLMERYEYLRQLITSNGSSLQDKHSTFLYRYLH